MKTSQQYVKRRDELRDTQTTKTRRKEKAKKKKRKKENGK